MIRRSLALLAILTFCATSLSAQRQQQQATVTELVIYVTYDDNNEALKMCRVQLFTSARMPIYDQFANDRGQVTFRVSPGSYFVQVTSTEIETTELSFVVNNRESMHTEYLHPKRRPVAGTQGSNEGSISTATLNIPDKARKEFEKGLAAFDKQDFPVAHDHFTKATEIYPQYSIAFLNLGVVAMRQDKSLEGQQYFERAIQADPHNAGAYTYLARVNILNAKYPEAQTLLEKAISITPLDPDPLTMLATAQLRSGQLQQTVLTAKKVHSVPHERYSFVHLLAAQALLAEQLPDLAADEYRLFLKESPDGPRADSARAALQSIESRTRLGR